jgi:hypothetical protein
MGTNQRSWIGSRPIFGSLCSKAEQTVKASKVGRWHARVALGQVDLEAQDMGKANCLQIREQGPQLIATGCSGFNGVTRAWGYQMAEFFDQYLNEGIDMNNAMLHIWACEKRELTRNVILRDPWEPKLPVYGNVLTLLDGPQMNYRTSDLEIPLVPNITTTCPVCDDVCQSSPNRTKYRNCVWDTFHLIKADPIKKLRELAMSNATTSRTGTTVVAAIVHACKTRSTLIAENSKFLFTASGLNLQACKEYCHEHRAVFVWLIGDASERGLNQSRERVGFFVIPYSYGMPLDGLVAEEERLQLRMEAVFEQLKVQPFRSASAFFKNIRMTFKPVDAIVPRKMRTDTGLRKDGNGTDCDYVKYMKFKFDENHVPWHDVQCPKSLTRHEFNKDPHFYNAGPQGQVAIRYHDYNSPDDASIEDCFIGWGCGATRNVLRKGFVGTFTRKGHWFDRAARKTLCGLQHFAGQGYDPDDFPHVMSLCETEQIHVSGDAIAATFSQDLFTTYFLTNKLQKPDDANVHEARLVKCLTHLGPMPSCSGNVSSASGVKRNVRAVAGLEALFREDKAKKANLRRRK